MAFAYSGTFTITAAPSITLTGPTGTLTVGDTVNITWTTTGTVGNVKIELYKSTSKVSTITNSTANDGTFSWDIQSTQLSGTSSLYKLKIFETDGDPVDYSNFLTINAEILRTPSNSAQFTEVVTRVNPSDTWKTVRQPTDSVQFSDDDVDDDKRVWKTIKSTQDSIQFSDDNVGDSKRIWKRTITTGDSASFTEAIESPVLSARVPTETVSFTEAIVKENTQWKKFSGQSDGVQFSEDEVIPTLKQPKQIPDSVSFNEQISNWVKSIFYIGNASSFIEVVDPEKRTWKHTPSPMDSIQFSDDAVNSSITDWFNLSQEDSIQFSEDDVDDDKRIWKQLHPQSDTVIFPPETVAGVPRIWKHIKDQYESLSFTETTMDDWYISYWHRFYGDDVEFSELDINGELSMDNWSITQWHRFYEENIAFTEDDVDFEIKTWHHLINDVIAFTEQISDVFGEAPSDSTQFIESVTSAIFKSCKVRKFADSSTEEYGVFRKSGWFSSTDADGNPGTIRRLNVEYNSADPLDFRIYIDGDDTNHAFLTSLPAATGVDTTNKSVRVGKRAKNFMLEIASVESTNSNIKIEDIELEIDGKV